MELEAKQKEQEVTAKRPPTLGQILLTFLKIGGSAFGGGTQALVFRETVDRRGWMTEKEFLTGQALSQVLPGANPVNVALYVGLRLRGGMGALTAVMGMIIPAFTIIMAMGTVTDMITPTTMDTTITTTRSIPCTIPRSAPSP